MTGFSDAEGSPAVRRRPPLLFSDTHRGPYVRLATLATFDHPYQADLVIALLADAGIPARRAGAYLPGMSTFFSGQVSNVRVEVPEDRLEEARALIEQANLENESEDGDA